MIKEVWGTITKCAVVSMLAGILSGCGAVKAIYANMGVWDDRNPAEKDRPLENKYTSELANRFGLMALFSEIAYRRSLNDVRTLDFEESDCDLLMGNETGMPFTKSGGRWHRLSDILISQGGDPSIGCYDDRRSGLFYEVYVFRSVKGSYLEAVIAYRGTENKKGQVSADWETNLSAVFGFEPPQYSKAKDRFPELLETLMHLNGELKVKDKVEIYATGHSLGGGLAQQAGYLSREVKEVFTFNTSPVTNWMSLRLKGKVDNNFPVIYRLYHTGEFLHQIRKITTDFNSSRFGRFDIGVQIEPKSLGKGHGMKIFACEFARRLEKSRELPARHYYTHDYAQEVVLIDPELCGEKKEGE